MSTASEKRAPVQGMGDLRSMTPKSRPPGTVPWDVHERAWKVYAAAFGRSQSAERIAERGGFSYAEMRCLLAGHSPWSCPAAHEGDVEGWKQVGG